MELVEMDYYFQCLNAWKLFFPNPWVARFGGLKLFFHLFVFWK